MQSDSFQSGPPGDGKDDELPTVRVRPPTPGSTPTPPEQPPAASSSPSWQQPGAFPPAPQPDFGAPTQFPPAGPGSAPSYPPPPQPGAGSQPQPGFGAPPQPAFGTPPPQGYPPPQPAFGTPPQQPAFGSQPQPGFGAPPAQPGFGAPPPQGYPPTQPGFSGPPPGFSGTQPGYGMPPQGYPQQPGFPPGGPVYSPPRKRRGGLFAVIAIIVVVVLIVGVVGVLALTSKKPNNTTGTNNTPASTPTVAPTPTSSVPSGFQKFSNTEFSISYPGDWTAKTSSGSDGEDFAGPQGQIFQVLVQQHADQAEIPTLLSTLCSLFGKPIGSVTTINAGGQPWQQETCGNDGKPDGTVDATFHGDSIYTMDYFSLETDFTSDKTQFYGPMEQSFAFAS